MSHFVLQKHHEIEIELKSTIYLNNVAVENIQCLNNTWR